MADTMHVSNTSHREAERRKDSTRPDGRVVAGCNRISRWCSAVARHNFTASVTTTVDAEENGYDPSTALSLKTSRARACMKVSTKKNESCNGQPDDPLLDPGRYARCRCLLLLE